MIKAPNKRSNLKKIKYFSDRVSGHSDHDPDSDWNKQTSDPDRVSRSKLKSRDQHCKTKTSF